MKLITRSTFFTFLILNLISCGGSDSSPASTPSPLKVVDAIEEVADIIEDIAEQLPVEEEVVVPVVEDIVVVVPDVVDEPEVEPANLTDAMIQVINTNLLTPLNPEHFYPPNTTNGAVILEDYMDYQIDNWITQMTAQMSVDMHELERIYPAGPFGLAGILLHQTRFSYFTESFWINIENYIIELVSVYAISQTDLNTLLANAYLRQKDYIFGFTDKTEIPSYLHVSQDNFKVVTEDNILTELAITVDNLKKAGILDY